MRSYRYFVGFSAFAISCLCAQAQTTNASEPAVTVVSSEAAQLKRLFAESDEANLKRNPISALFRGDLRYADRLGDYVTSAYFDAERKAGEEDLKRLRAINRTSLSDIDKISYDVFEEQTLLALRGLSKDILALTAVRPIDHMNGFHTFYPDLASGQGAAPFQNIADYENNLKRHHEFVLLIDRSIERFREGLVSGVVQPKLTVLNMIDQLDIQIAQGIEGSTYYGPVKIFPDGIGVNDQSRLKLDYAAVIAQEIIPAYTRLRDFLRNDYLPKSRAGAGLIHMKGGIKLYNYLIELNTTLPLTAPYVHKLGLSEVKRIKSEMDTIRIKIGFKGSLAAFFCYLRTDPKFKLASKDALRDRYYAIGKTVDARISEQFSMLPKSVLEIRAVPEYKEKTDAAGYYQSGTADSTRPGVFYFNGYDLPSRTTPGMETLYLHEGAPGHHFQISLAQENEALPAFMRFGGNTAYVEGWALYAETLWDELGMQTDPYSRFGGLDYEMLRAMRLVVDTGLHAKGWTRERAIKYMLDNSSMGETDARAEVERYIALPGQALAYKIVQITLLRLKGKAINKLGEKFDPRRFHAQVLNTGALPLGVLEKKIEAWIVGGGI